MSVKLVRANADTPNIQNSDDCRLFRYACGGYDGIVKGFGNELNYEISGSNFIVKSGEFVIDGWQGKIDGSGVSIAVDNLGGVQYYVVYAEIDLSVSANQKAEIKATYNTAYYPTISRGDDLTTTPSGVARIELYRFTASSGVISNVIAQFEIVEVGNVLHAENADLATLATNATNATNAINEYAGTFAKLETDINGILKYGDLIIPQKKPLWIGSPYLSVNTSSEGSLTLSENLSVGDIIEIEYCIPYSSDGYYQTKNFAKLKCILTSNGGLILKSNIVSAPITATLATGLVGSFGVYIENSTPNILKIKHFTSSSDLDLYVFVYSVYKIIE